MAERDPNRLRRTRELLKRVDKNPALAQQLGIDEPTLNEMREYVEPTLGEQLQKGLGVVSKYSDIAASPSRTLLAGAHDLAYKDLGVEGQSLLKPGEFGKSLNPLSSEFAIGEAPTTGELFARKHPEIAAEWPIATAVGGFAGDVWSDPLTHIPVTAPFAIAGKAVRAAKAFKKGQSLLQKGSDLLEAGTSLAKAVPGAKPVAALGTAAAKATSTVVSPWKHIYSAGVKHLDEYAGFFGKTGKYAPSRVLLKHGVWGKTKNMPKELDSLASNLKSEHDMIVKKFAGRVDVDAPAKNLINDLDTEIDFLTSADGEALPMSHPMVQDLLDARNEVSQYLSPDRVDIPIKGFDVTGAPSSRAGSVAVDKDLGFIKHTGVTPETAQKLKTSLYNKQKFRESVGSGDTVDATLGRFAKGVKDSIHKSVYDGAYEYAQKMGFGKNPAQWDDYAKQQVNKLEETGQELGTVLTVMDHTRKKGSQEALKPLISVPMAVAIGYNNQIAGAMAAQKLLRSDAIRTGTGMFGEAYGRPIQRRALINIGRPEEEEQQ